MPDIYLVCYNMELRNQEWSYRFNKSGDDADTILGTADGTTVGSAQDSRWLDALMAMHSEATILASVSVANTSRRGIGDTAIEYTDRGRTARHGEGLVTPDVTNTSIVLALKGARYDRRLSLGGVPDSFVERDANGRKVQTADFTTALTPFKSRLAAMGFGVRYRVPPDAANPESPLSWRTVVSMSPAPALQVGGALNDSWTVFTTVSPHGLAAGDLVAFERREMKRELRGLGGDIRVINAPTTTTFTLDTAYLSRDEVYAPPRVRVRKATYALDPIEEGKIKFVDFATRKRGSSRGPRGAAPAQKNRH